MRTASILAALLVPAAILAIAYIARLGRTPAIPGTAADAERAARLFAAIDEMGRAATDVIVAASPGVDADRIRAAMSQQLQLAVLELADLAGGV